MRWGKPSGVSEYDNLYLCPRCEHVGPLNDEDMTCEKCEYDSCFVAKHITEKNRRRWMKIEEDGVNWRKEKRITNMLKNHLPHNKDLAKAFTKSIGRFFAYMSNHKHGMDKLFPKFTRDYQRTTGERVKRHWNDHRSAAQIKHDSIRGVLYEGAFQRFASDKEEFERVYEPFVIENVNDEIKLFEPDMMFLWKGLKIPVEFKTYAKGALVKKKIQKGIKQSRRYGRLSKYLGTNQGAYSCLILCCPEERKYSCVVIDRNVDNF